jgi:hypothetical protein
LKPGDSIPIFRLGSGMISLSIYVFAGEGRALGEKVKGFFGWGGLWRQASLMLSIKFTP